MPKSLTVTWQLPTLRTDGSALATTDVKGSEVALSADNGVTFTVLATVPPGETQSLNRDLADGGYKIRIVTVDSLEQRGVPAIGDVVVKTVSPPSAPRITGIVVV